MPCICISCAKNQYNPHHSSEQNFGYSVCLGVFSCLCGAGAAYLTAKMIRSNVDLNPIALVWIAGVSGACVAICVACAGVCFYSGVKKICETRSPVLPLHSHPNTVRQQRRNPLDNVFQRQYPVNVLPSVNAHQPTPPYPNTNLNVRPQPNPLRPRSQSAPIIGSSRPKVFL